MNAPFHFVPHAEPFFFDVDPGTRFCMYHPPSTHVPPRGVILYVHPFAEELNLSRRMAAQQARAFAGLGFAVLQIDLFGCGDSCAIFPPDGGINGNATWRWLQRGCASARSAPCICGVYGWAP
jgi:alpha-beta hydrolase superfamily lysophospholipase